MAAAGNGQFHGRVIVLVRKPFRIGRSHGHAANQWWTGATDRRGENSIVRHRQSYRRPLIGLVLLGPLLAGCAGASDMFSSDLLSKDADWFSRPGRVFIRNVSIEAPPLTPEKAVGPEDLISAEGACPGMAPADANALSNNAAGAPVARSGSVALGHTECDVARSIGAPDNVQLSNGPRGDRLAVLTYARGPRAGIYTFTAGRLSMVERGPEATPQPKPARRKPRASG
ncbi:MAG: hypothetical protein JWR29_1124 [Tardiphaga sp.]|nr:hypothetical protein [Tardiphaga sp.]